jgi:hypothetical protein
LIACSNLKFGLQIRIMSVPQHGARDIVYKPEVVKWYTQTNRVRCINEDFRGITNTTSVQFNSIQFNSIHVQ